LKGKSKDVESFDDHYEFMQVGDEEFQGLMYAKKLMESEEDDDDVEREEWDEEDVELPEIVLGIAKVDVALTKLTKSHASTDVSSGAAGRPSS